MRMKNMQYNHRLRNTPIAAEECKMWYVHSKDVNTFFGYDWGELSYAPNAEHTLLVFLLV